VIHHILLLIGALNATQLESLIAALTEKLHNDEAQPLAKPVLETTDDEIDCLDISVASTREENEEEHERLWGAIDKLDNLIETLNLNRNSF
jgi:hypothetical protein